MCGLSERAGGLGGHRRRRRGRLEGGARESNPATHTTTQRTNAFFHSGQAASLGVQRVSVRLSGWAVEAWA
jgi:hypothetical protein